MIPVTDGRYLEHLKPHQLRENLSFSLDKVVLHRDLEDLSLLTVLEQNLYEGLVPVPNPTLKLKVYIATDGKIDRMICAVNMKDAGIRLEVSVNQANRGGLIITTHPFDVLVARREPATVLYRCPARAYRRLNQYHLTYQRALDDWAKT